MALRPLEPVSPGARTALGIAFFVVFVLAWGTATLGGFVPKTFLADPLTMVRSGYDLLAPMIAGPWAVGDTFTLADCAALPALFYADHALRLVDWPALDAYLGRLKARPSVARVLAG